MKIATFWEFCASCKHKNVPETEEPCNECLSCGAREDSHRPLNYEEGKDKK